MNTVKTENWQNVNFQDFWAEIAPADHLVQIYESEKVFMNTLEGFVGSGLLANDTVIIIATAAHLDELNARLKRQEIDVDLLIAKKKFVPLDAKEILSKFMVNSWPDEKRFFQTVSSLMEVAKNTKSRVRAFGEMVALLWEEGNYGATVHLEHLWNKFCSTQALCLYCAYPKTGFTKDPAESIKNICCTHSKVIGGWESPSTEIHYCAGT